MIPQSRKAIKMYNKVILMGRLTRDPELKTTPNGISVATFSIAVDRRFAKSGEERKTDFFNIVAWRQQAEFVSKFFYKGRSILVEGEIQNRSYVDKDGVTRYITEVIADNVSFTGEPKGSNTGAGTYSNAPHPADAINEKPAASAGSASDFVNTVDDEEYPF